MARVQGKSRTGGLYRRAGLIFRADAWTIVDVRDEVLAILRADVWLDLKDASGAPDQAVAVVVTDDLAGRLQAALVRIETLEAELAEARRAHLADLDMLTAPTPPKPPAPPPTPDPGPPPPPTPE